MIALLRLLAEGRGKGGTITFIYAASDEERNSARVLKEVVEGGEK